jgi:hypothetical protein
MHKLRKLDSFLRESARLNPIALGTFYAMTVYERLCTTIVALIRHVRRDFTFSDGTFVKRGNWVCASSYSIHMDESHYTKAGEFDPWRFSDIRSIESEATRHQYITTTPDFLSFGSGKHAWCVFSISYMTSSSDEILMKSWPILCNK